MSQLHFWRKVANGKENLAKLSIGRILILVVTPQRFIEAIVRQMPLVVWSPQAREATNYGNRSKFHHVDTQNNDAL